MVATAGFSIRFWGVRGSIACPGPGTVRYGGNTSCVEIRCGDRILIMDGGTGLRELGDEMLRTGGRIDADLFYTHTHFDHICGLPFFAPCYVPGNMFRIWAGHLLPDNSVENVLCGMMMAPLFPVPMTMLNPQLDFKDFRQGATLTPHPGITLRTAPLNHPNGATGYRVEYDGKSVAYITDTEHKPGELDANVLALVDQADLMIYDSTYTDEEYLTHVAWGHSTWQQGIRLADAAKVKTLVIFHHDPSHDDAFMDRVGAAAAERRPGTIVAREGLVLTP
jgi:phosphoribosyl 1,2-cyclic phosphodiesterase